MSALELLGLLASIGVIGVAMFTARADGEPRAWPFLLLLAIALALAAAPHVARWWHDWGGRV